MAANTRGPRRRSRKSRPRASKPRVEATTATQATDAGAAKPRVEAPVGREGTGGGANERQAGATAARTAGGRGRRVPAHRNFEERPPAPWHPLPLSELLIVAGAVAFALALSRLGHHGVAAGGPLLLAGILALGLGTAEVSWREHRSGFRSHTLLLAFIPVLVLHTLVVVGYAQVASPSRALNVGMLVVDIAVFFVLARHLRARFLDARARR